MSLTKCRSCGNIRTTGKPACWKCGTLSIPAKTSEENEERDDEGRLDENDVHAFANAFFKRFGIS